MSEEASATGTKKHICLLLVEPHRELGEELAAWLQGRGFEVVRTATAKEARAALQDARLIGKQYDGLLTDSSVLGFAAYCVISTFQDQFPGRPVAAMAGPGDRLIDLWARVQSVHVLRKPFSVPILEWWCHRAMNASPTPMAASGPAVHTAC